MFLLATWTIKIQQKKYLYTSMLKYWNVFSDIPEKSKYFLNLIQGDTGRERLIRTRLIRSST